jgi:hypothetical protein
LTSKAAASYIFAAMWTPVIMLLLGVQHREDDGDVHLEQGRNQAEDRSSYMHGRCYVCKHVDQQRRRTSALFQYYSGE